MYEMPLIESDFCIFVGVGFNLPYCFEIPFQIKYVDYP